MRKTRRETKEGRRQGRVYSTEGAVKWKTRETLGRKTLVLNNFTGVLRRVEQREKKHGEKGEKRKDDQSSNRTGKKRERSVVIPSGIEEEVH